MDLMIYLFWDEEEGGFFFVSKEGPSLLIPQKEIYDGSIPSGNSVAALDILHLARLLADKKIENKAASLFRVFSEKIFHTPDEYCQLLLLFSMLSALPKSLYLPEIKMKKNLRL